MEENLQLNPTVDQLLNGTGIHPSKLFSSLPHNLSSLTPSATLFSNFLTSIKLDGVMFKFINQGANGYLVSRNTSITHVCSDFPLTAKTYIIDFECVLDTLWMIDIHYITNSNYDFTKRYNFMHIIQAKVPTIGKYKINVSKYNNINIFSRDDILRAEGLIFISIYDLYTSRSIYKWKNLTYQTIDFLVKTGDVFIEDKVVAKTNRADGVYSVNIHDYSGHHRTDKIKSNSLFVAQGIINDSVIALDTPHIATNPMFKTDIRSVFAEGLAVNINFSQMLNKITFNFFSYIRTSTDVIPVVTIIQPTTAKPPPPKLKPKKPFVARDIHNQLISTKVEYGRKLNIDQFFSRTWTQAAFTYVKPPEVKKFTHDRYTIHRDDRISYTRQHLRGHLPKLVATRKYSKPVINSRNNGSYRFVASNTNQDIAPDVTDVIINSQNINKKIQYYQVLNSAPNKIKVDTKRKPTQTYRKKKSLQTINNNSQESVDHNEHTEIEEKAPRVSPNYKYRKKVNDK